MIQIPVAMTEITVDPAGARWIPEKVQEKGTEFTVIYPTVANKQGRRIPGLITREFIENPNYFEQPRDDDLFRAMTEDDTRFDILDYVYEHHQALYKYL